MCDDSTQLEYALAACRPQYLSAILIIAPTARRHRARAEIKHRRYQRVEIACVGAVIDDSRPYRELAVEDRRRWSRDPGFLNIDDNIAIYLVGVRSAIAKADDIELDRRQQLQPRLG